jgi:putative ubiquitin-RnfH superfamily antitoxin RatB of RatAB toxin-antitoxin module
MHIEVAYALPDHQHRVHLELLEGARVADALAAVSKVSPFRDLDLAVQALAVFGRRVAHDDELRHGDRIDILRPLLVDPKEARRRRAAGGSERR